MQKFLLIILLSISVYCSYAQNSIGIINPNPNAALDIASLTKGILIPRMDSTHRKGIINTKGLIVYDSTTNTLWQNNGSTWLEQLPLIRGNSVGDMIYWNGNAWIMIPAGVTNQPLMNCNGIPTWGGCPPTITTANNTGTTIRSVFLGGDISNEGSLPTLERGIVMGFSTLPTVTNSDKYAMGQGGGRFVNSISVTAPYGATRYVRAYARNQAGIYYGNEITFTLSIDTGLWITTLPITWVDGRPVSGGIISSDGGRRILERGVVFGNIPIPTLAAGRTSDGIGKGTYTSAIDYLIGQQSQVIAFAYARTSAGTTYGSQTAASMGDFAVGQTIGSARVFYVDTSKKHGFMMTVVNSANNPTWYSSTTGNIPTNATGTGFGTGRTNTTAIITAQDVGNYAAYLCDTMTVNGSSDWYLPSLGEAKILLQNLRKWNIPELAYPIATSTESDTSNFFTVALWNNSFPIQSTASKSLQFTTAGSTKLIAIRAF